MRKRRFNWQRGMKGFRIRSTWIWLGYGNTATRKLGPWWGSGSLYLEFKLFSINFSA